MSLFTNLESSNTEQQSLESLNNEPQSIEESLDAMKEFLNFRRPQGVKSKITLEKEKKILDLYRTSKQSMDDIARTVGISRNTLYKFIKSKKAEIEKKVNELQTVDN
jgi:transcriptional regulator of acetoin/glycerol metabolism